MAAANRRSGPPTTLLLTALVVAPLLIAPNLIRGLAADAWVSYTASLGSLHRPRKPSARALVQKADLAIQNLAPLPQAAGAAMRALEIGQRVEHQDHDREAALIIYQGVRLSCARIQSRPLSGAGFAVIEARAAALEDSARSKTVAKAPPPK